MSAVLAELPLVGNGLTVLTSTPLMDLAQTWNASGVTFTGLRFNATDTSSAANSLLLDLQVSGGSKFNIDKSGKVIFGNSGFFVDPSASALGVTNTTRVFGSTGEFRTRSAGVFNWSSDGTGFGAPDTGLSRSAAGAVAVGNGTAADASGTLIAKTLKNTTFAVGSLPSAATAGAGARMFVTDANATTFASIVAGGGSNGVPVYSDGTNWRIG